MRIMKHIHLLFPILAVALAVSCAPNYQEDIDRLNDQYARIDQRVTELEKTVSGINDQLQQLSILATAVEKYFYITEVKNHDGVYELILANDTKIVLQQGPDKTLLPMPPISMMQINGFYFWTIGGMILTGPDGSPIRASAIVPVVKFDTVTNEYLISIDGGVTFQSINVYASVIINNDVLMQIINSYFSQHSTVLLDQQMLFQIISTYIQRNYSSLFNVEVLDQAVAAYIRENESKLFNYQLLEQIFSQYDFEYYTSQIDVDHLVGVIVDFLNEHGEILSDNEVLFQIITSYLKANQASIFSSEMLLEVINEFIQSGSLVIDVDLLTRIVTNYIDTHRDEVFDTDVVRAMLLKFVQKYYVQAFNDNILVRLLNFYVSSNSSTIFNETLIRDILSVYVQNNYTTILTREVINSIINTYIEQNASTILNAEMLTEVVSNYFQANYDLIIDRTLITNLFNTYIEEHKDTLISSEVIESIVMNYLKEYYLQVFSADILSTVITSYFESNTQIIKEIIGDSADVVADVSTNSECCVITLTDGTTIQLVVYDDYARLRNRVQSVVIVPEENGHVLEQKTTTKEGYLDLTYLVSPADMASVIQTKFQKGEILMEFRTTNESGSVSKLDVYEPHQVSSGLLSVKAWTPNFGTVKNIALYIRELQSGGTDIMTEFTPVDSEEVVEDPDYVDLGLPSGIMWGKYNLGAAKPEEDGNYYAWGETATKSKYDISTYKYCNGSLWNFTKYVMDSNYGTRDMKSTFADYDFKDDAARVILKDKWRTPTDTEWKELLDYCTWKQTTDYNGTGKFGYVVTSKKYTDRSIFIPAADKRSTGTWLGPSGYYMSSCLRTSEDGVSTWSESILYFTLMNGLSTPGGDRAEGYSVRPVYGDFVRLTSINVKESNYSMKVGQTYTLTPVFKPSNASYKTHWWESCQPDIVSVEPMTGTITALAKGTADIEIWPADYSVHYGICHITVTD